MRGRKRNFLVRIEKVFQFRVIRMIKEVGVRSLKSEFEVKHKVKLREHKFLWENSRVLTDGKIQTLKRIKKLSK